MKVSILTSAFALTGFLAAATPHEASALVYCKYIGYPKGCIARAGVVLRPRPVVRAVTPGLGAPGVGIRRGIPMNRGGPVNRIGRR